MTTRRMPRSPRMIGALVLLVTSVGVAVAGIVAASVPALVGSTVYAVLAGAVAARVLYGEIAGLRLGWAHDRAKVADDYRTIAVARSREHITFAEQMSQRVSLRDRQIAVLRDSLVTVEIELAQAREKVSAERARLAALQDEADAFQSDLESARTDLRQAQDALAASESAEMQVRSELLAWQEVAAEDERQYDRKPA